MTVDVAVVGSPFLDLVLEGLPRVPAIGEEIVGQAFHVAPGGTAIQAIGLARLGLSVALVSPRAGDLGGRLIADMLEHEQVAWVGADGDRTPTTAVLSTPGGAAMATAPGGEEPGPDEVAAVGPARVVLSLGRAHLRPRGVPACFVTGPVEIEAGADLPHDTEPQRDLLVLNGAEAMALTHEAHPDGAARALGGRVAAFITLGAEGAIGAHGGRVARAVAPTVETVDATGAGDLFISAIVWADVHGLSLHGKLEWACLYAGLSVTSPTALGGARRLDDVLEEGRRRGLSPP